MTNLLRVMLHCGSPPSRHKEAIGAVPLRPQRAHVCVPVRVPSAGEGLRQRPALPKAASRSVGTLEGRCHL